MNMGCQLNVNRDVLDETDWLGVAEVHPHGLDMFVLYFWFLGTILERRCGRDSKRFKCGCQ